MYVRQIREFIARVRNRLAKLGKTDPVPIVNVVKVPVAIADEVPRTAGIPVDAVASPATVTNHPVLWHVPISFYLAIRELLVEVPGKIDVFRRGG
jgi:hypothetical protein